MGHKKADKIPRHAVAWKQKIQKYYVQNICKDIVAHTGLLLPQSFGHGIGDGIAVEHGYQKRIEPEAESGFPAAVEPQAQKFRQQIQQPTEQHSVEDGNPQAAPYQISDTFFAPCRGTSGQLRDQQLRKPIQDAGREHEDGEHHAADHTKGCQWIFHKCA